MYRLTSCSVFLFSALAVSIKSGYSVGAVMLFLGSAVLLWKRPRLGLNNSDYLLIGVLLLYFLYYSANSLFHGDQGREFDSPARPLLAIPVLLLLLAYPPRPAAWWSGLAVGAIGGCIVVAWQYLVLDLPRPEGVTGNAIQYGNVSMLLGLLAMAGLGWAREQSHKGAWTTLLLLGAAAGVAGSIFSGSRGGWLALPACAWIFLQYHANKHGKRYLLGGLLTLAALTALGYVLPNSPLRTRAEIGYQDMVAFERNGNVETSIGQRLEMWRTALSMSAAHPLIGLGSSGYMEQKRILVSEGKMNHAVRDTTNAHNDYLDALVKRGAPGLLVLLALLLAPLILFTGELQRGLPAARPYALAGVALCVCYLLFGLSTTSLTLNIGTMLLVFPMVIIWALIRAQQPALAR